MPALQPKRVMLIGWDAADWSFMSPLLDSGKMPSLQRVIEGGTSGRVATLQPVLSPILWTSIATGKRGDKHGVLSFVEPTADGSGIRTVGSPSRQAKALWNILSQVGRRSVVVNWFASHPAEPIDGAIVSNRFSETALIADPAEDSTFHPRDLASVMEQLRVTAAKITPEQMLPFFPERLPKNDDTRLQALASFVAQTASIHNAATYLAEAEEWDFLAVYYDMIDHVGHGFSEFGEPRMAHVSEADFATYRHVMESTYRFHDLMLGRWLEIAGHDTAIILLSDHGFAHGASRPLAERGRLSGERAQGVHTNPLIWHRLHGVLAAHGPGIKPDQIVHSASLLDVAPTILALLGVPVPADFEGQVLTQMFVQPPDIEAVDSYEAPHPLDGMIRDAAPEDRDPWAAQAALMQLAQLGYIEDPSANGPTPALKTREAHDSHLAQILFSTGRFAGALEILDDLVTRSTDPSYPCRRAMCLIALERLDEAETIVNAVMTELPHYGLAKMLLAQIASIKGRTEEAEKLFDELREADAQMPALHNQVAGIYLQQERWSEAVELFEKVLAADEDSPEAHDGLGVALRHLGRLEDSIYQHMQAVSLQHDRPQTHINLGISLAHARHFHWAVRAFNVAAELAPKEPYPHRCLARVYRRALHDRDKALHHLLRARDLRRELGRSRPAFRHGV
ncbi:MAG: alkaline phosphatase family protein [Verrucomicrobiota bacterium]|nr:alkaline phosphatase family protein [Verrucomicrobiota bacterium]